MSLLPFDTEDEAIAHGQRHAVTASVPGIFTRDVGARPPCVSERLRAGICWVNTYRAISPIAPSAASASPATAAKPASRAILDYTRTKTTWINTSAEPMANPFVMR